MTDVLKRNNGLADLDGAVQQPSDWLHGALSIPREEGWVTVDGCDLHYFRWGDTSKPGLLLMHGFLAHARCFAFIAPFLADNYHIVAYDHSGMGDSGHRNEYPESLRVHEACSVARATGLFEHAKKPLMIAHSYGGHVATSAMHDHPELFAGYIILDTMIFRPSYYAENSEMFSPPGSGIADKPNKVYPDYPSAKARFRLSPEQSVGAPELFDYMAYHSLRQVDGGWSWKFDPRVFKGDSNIQDAWLKAGERVVTAPGRKAIVYGENSKLFSADSELYMRELLAQFELPNFPIVGVPHAAHHLMLDQPIALAAVLRTILASWLD